MAWPTLPSSALGHSRFHNATQRAVGLLFFVHHLNLGEVQRDLIDRRHLMVAGRTIRASPQSCTSTDRKSLLALRALARSLKPKAYASIGFI
jgi:hypothetical protein